MSQKTHITLLLILAGLLSGANIHAQTPPETGSSSVTVLLFESEQCEECRPVYDSLHQIQQQVTPGKLNLVRYVVEKPESRDAFIQHQVTALPEYLVVAPNQEILLNLKGRIEPEVLIWQVKESLGLNPSLAIPANLRAMTSGDKITAAYRLIVFRANYDAKEQSLMDAAMAGLSGIPPEKAELLSLDATTPWVSQWARELGISSFPAYLVLSPNGSVYNQVLNHAQSWQLALDLTQLAGWLTPGTETIPVALPPTLTTEGAIHPATTAPSPQPASGEPSPPELPLPGI